MHRKTFDTLVSGTGLLIAAVLLAASGLLLWAHSFIDNNIRTQLSAEQVYFPTKGSAALDEAGVKPYLTRYAGEQLLTGAQAKAYADHFIAVHLKTIGGGKTYSQLSTEAQAKPNDTALAAQVATVFKGETLRGLLLNAYAFGTMARLAFIAFWVALGSGLAMLVLAALGLLHARRTEPGTDLHVPGWHPENQPAS